MSIIGLGSSLSVSDGPGSSQQNFVAVKEISIPKADVEYVDSSYLNMGSSYREYVAGLIAPGDMSATLQYNKDDLARCYALRAVTQSYVITFPDNSTVEFDGILQNSEMTVGLDQIMEIKVSVRVTGAITFTPS